MNDIKFVSLADSVFERMEDDILSGEYPKGSVITESKLSQTLGVSRTPIREAIRRLEQEDLIKITTKGILIKGTDERDIEDIYEIRQRIEGLAAKRCAKVITDEQLESLCEIIEMQEYYTEKGMYDKIKDADSAFHEAIYEICGSHVFLSVLSGLHRRIRKFRKISVQNPGRAVLATAEHREIFNALCAHDEKLAEKLTEKHIGNARDNILKTLTK